MCMWPNPVATAASNLDRYVAESATEECRVPLDKEECEAHRTATPAFTDGSGHGIGASATSMSTFVDDNFLPFGCQWYVDPPKPELTLSRWNQGDFALVSASVWPDYCPLILALALTLTLALALTLTLTLALTLTLTLTLTVTLTRCGPTTRATSRRGAAGSCR